MHLRAAVSPCSYQASAARTSANVTGGHSLRRPRQNTAGSKRSSLAGDAREHPASVTEPVYYRRCMRCVSHDLV
ncbi:exported protein of unknown function [Modestobacter italicus]|uniref:Uncharacterized protein n=1 Tax=Modestobacter italicus (strain DSM 44449 / CECT 9708 / BC 501) TaxID=2732864 RepID=I4EX63_MODI5|nr:exported protein of unknown function [Modestobacter marinus]